MANDIRKDVDSMTGTFPHTPVFKTFTKIVILVIKISPFRQSLERSSDIIPKLNVTKSTGGDNISAKLV